MHAPEPARLGARPHALIRLGCGFRHQRAMRREAFRGSAHQPGARAATLRQGRSIPGRVYSRSNGVGDSPDDVALFELLNLGFIGIECILVSEDRVTFHVPWVCCAQASGMRERAHDFPGHRRGVVFQINRVGPRLAHFGLAIEPHQARYTTNQPPVVPGRADQTGRSGAARARGSSRCAAVDPCQPARDALAARGCLLLAERDR